MSRRVFSKARILIIDDEAPNVEVLRRLRAEVPDRELLVVWDGAPYHRAKAVQEVACELGITLMPLPGYSPDLMPVEALWRWLREDVTYHHCHATAEDLTRRAAAFEARFAPVHPRYGRAQWKDFARRVFCIE